MPPAESRTALIRAMSDADLDAIMRIETASYNYPWTRQIFIDCMRVGYHCLVLVDGGAVVGYTIVSSAAGEAHVLNLCVDPDKRRAGLARVLIEQAIAVVMIAGARIIFLEVRPSNLEAIGLYDQCGFVEIARRNNYYSAPNGREDAIVMSRQLVTEG